METARSECGGVDPVKWSQLRAQTRESLWVCSMASTSLLGAPLGSADRFAANVLGKVAAVGELLEAVSSVHHAQGVSKLHLLRYGSGLAWCIDLRGPLASASCPLVRLV